MNNTYSYGNYDSNHQVNQCVKDNCHDNNTSNDVSEVIVNKNNLNCEENLDTGYDSERD